MAPRRSRYRKFRRLVGRAAVLAAVGFALIWMLRSPSHDRDWAPEHAVLPVVAVDGDIARVRNVRDFRYQDDGTVVRRSYEDRLYDLSRVTGVWYGISQISWFSGIAHTFLSFGFADGTYLAVSIEARRRAGQGYGPIRGLFRNYELIYVLGDERDVIGLRSHVAGQPVRLYRIHMAPEVATGLLREVLAEVDRISREPRFYNTLIDNCTTGIVKHARAIPAWRRLTDYRILLPGYSDRLLFELGLLESGRPLDELRRRARIDSARVPPPGEGFSARLRKALE